MQDGLACVRSTVYRDVEARYRPVDRFQPGAFRLHKAVDGTSFGLPEVEVVDNMALRNDQGVKCGVRIEITNGVTKLIRHGDADGRHIAKRASGFSLRTDSKQAAPRCRLLGAAIISAATLRPLRHVALPPMTSTYMQLAAFIPGALRGPQPANSENPDAVLPPGYGQRSPRHSTWLEGGHGQYLLSCRQARAGRVRDARVLPARHPLLRGTNEHVRSRLRCERCCAVSVGRDGPRCRRHGRRAGDGHAVPSKDRACCPRFAAHQSGSACGLLPGKAVTPSAQWRTAPIGWAAPAAARSTVAPLSMPASAGRVARGAT